MILFQSEDAVFKFLRRSVNGASVTDLKQFFFKFLFSIRNRHLLLLHSLWLTVSHWVILETRRPQNCYTLQMSPVNCSEYDLLMLTYLHKLKATVGY